LRSKKLFAFVPATFQNVQSLRQFQRGTSICPAVLIENVL